jgi:hypothetical protein
MSHWLDSGDSLQSVLLLFSLYGSTTVCCGAMLKETVFTQRYLDSRTGYAVDDYTRGVVE